MERGLPRTSLTGSALMGLLANLGLVDGQTAAPCLVDGLGRWLGWADAIPLAAVLNAPLDTPPDALPRASAASAATAATATAIEREFAQVHDALGRAIADVDTAAGDWRRPGRRQAAAGPVAGAAASVDGDFSPYRRRYTDLQRAMAAGIGPLRAQARAAVARLSPGMRQLAAIDAVMDEVLGSREQTLLAAMPALLQKHFERLLQAHREATAAATLRGGDAPRATAAPGDWLGVFRRDMQRLLAAELDLRLQPVLGLLDALRTDRRAVHDQAAVNWHS